MSRPAIALGSLHHPLCDPYRAFTTFFIEQLYSSSIQLAERFEATALKDLQKSVADKSSKVGALSVSAFASSYDDPFLSGQTCVLSVEELNNLFGNQIRFLYVHYHPMTLRQLIGRQHTQWNVFYPDNAKKTYQPVQLLINAIVPSLI